MLCMEGRSNESNHLSITYKFVVQVWNTSKIWIGVSIMQHCQPSLHFLPSLALFELNGVENRIWIGKDVDSCS